MKSFRFTFILLLVMALPLSGWAQTVMSPEKNETVAATEAKDTSTEDDKKVKQADPADRPYIKQENKSDYPVDVVEPVKKQQISMPLLLGLDLLVPGGGHFYRGSYIMGGTFLTLKVAGGYSIYYFYKEWQYIRSLYFSAKKANAELDPDHELLFADPRGGYKTVTEFKREYDSAAQNITFTIVANVVLYSVSLAVNYIYASEFNEDRAPAFSVYYAMAPEKPMEGVMGAMYTYRY